MSPIIIFLIVVAITGLTVGILAFLDIPKTKADSHRQ